MVPLNALQAPLVEEVLRGDAQMLSVLNLFMSIGMLAGSFSYPTIAKRFGTSRLLCTSGMGLGLCLAGFVAGGQYADHVAAVYATLGAASLGLGILVGLIQCCMSAGFIKSIDKRYLARSASLFNAAGGAAVPVLSGAVSAVALIFRVDVIFMTAGALCVILFLCLSLKKVDFEKGQ